MMSSVDEQETVKFCVPTAQQGFTILRCLFGCIHFEYCEVRKEIKK